MLTDWVLYQGPLTYESSVLPFALRGPALHKGKYDRTMKWAYTKIIETINA